MLENLEKSVEKANPEFEKLFKSIFNGGNINWEILIEEERKRATSAEYHALIDELYQRGTLSSSEKGSFTLLVKGVADNFGLSRDNGYTIGFAKKRDAEIYAVLKYRNHMTDDIEIAEVLKLRANRSPLQ